MILEFLRWLIRRRNEKSEGTKKVWVYSCGLNIKSYLLYLLIEPNGFKYWEIITDDTGCHWNRHYLGRKIDLFRGYRPRLIPVGIKKFKKM